MIEGAEQDIDSRAADVPQEPAPGAGPRSGHVVRAVLQEGEDAVGGFAVRPPVASDARRLAALWAEMQRHYGRPVAEATAAAAAAVACRAGPAAGFEPRVLVAVADTGAVVGAIALNVAFPAGELTRSLHIRDLYVALAARRQGVARGLLRAAAALTLLEGFSSLDWTADARNAGARRFYERAGAARLERVYFRLGGGDLRRAASC